MKNPKGMESVFSYMNEIWYLKDHARPIIILKSDFSELLEVNHKKIKHPNF